MGHPTALLVLVHASYMDEPKLITNSTPYPKDGDSYCTVSPSQHRGISPEDSHTSI
uniref:Uncharacterized protein n=1 Tax=Anguilla anguilla TaxID=7936 RepID=A0A0E9R2J5_ANGAN